MLKLEGACPTGSDALW